jgi:hypothetical protein
MAKMLAILLGLLKGKIALSLAIFNTNEDKYQ